MVTGFDSSDAGQRQIAGCRDLSRALPRRHGGGVHAASVTGRFVLGSDTEVISFEHERAEYRRLGTTHAVDLHDPVNRPNATMGYALCGKPVRIWRDEPFDPNTAEAHEQCVRAAHVAAAESVAEPR
jgi:hypothetical protein